MRQRVYAITPDMREREPYEVRRAAQRATLNLPLVPTTTPGWFPPSDEFDELLMRAAESIDLDPLWANPDGGLTTRHEWQLEPALHNNLVAAARQLRRRVGAPRS